MTEIKAIHEDAAKKKEDKHNQDLQGQQQMEQICSFHWMAQEQGNPSITEVWEKDTGGHV